MRAKDRDVKSAARIRELLVLGAYPQLTRPCQNARRESDQAVVLLRCRKSGRAVG